MNQTRRVRESGYFVKKALEEQIRKIYEAQLNDAFSALVKEFDTKWCDTKEVIAQDVVKHARSLTMEMLHKADIRGISVEFKL